MRDTALGNEPEPVTEFLEEYNVTERFETELDRVHVQSLGMEIHGTEPRGAIRHDLIQWEDGHACVYYPPNVEFSAVLMFPTGWGYYCCQSPRDLDEIDEWFTEKFNEYVEDGFVPVQLNEQ